MTDREKVIEELERLSEWLFHQYQVVYDGDAPNYYDAYKTVDDAIALLKEQEPVEPKEERLDDVDSIYRCGNCGTHFYYRQQKYCAICGRKAKWYE